MMRLKGGGAHASVTEVHASEARPKGSTTTTMRKRRRRRMIKKMTVMALSNLEASENVHEATIH